MKRFTSLTPAGGVFEREYRIPRRRRERPSEAVLRLLLVVAEPYSLSDTEPVQLAIERGAAAGDKRCIGVLNAVRGVRPRGRPPKD